MSQRRRRIFQRVSKILKVSILRRPIIPRLKLIPIKPRRSVQRVKLLQQYNHWFLQEYQSSPLHKSFITSCRKRIRISRLSLKRIYKLLFLSRCIISQSNEDTKAQSWMEMEALHYVLGVASPATELSQPLDYFSEDDSIDLKAERFIKKFYNDMRMEARGIA